MNRIISFIIKAALVCVISLAMLSCDPQGGKETPVDVTGDWELQNVENTSVYVSFGQDGDFQLYQKLGEGRYRKFTGVYTVDVNIVSGTYSDGTSWGTDYKASISGLELTMVSLGGSGTAYTYASASIPDSVIEEAVEVKSGISTGEELPFL